MKHWIAVAIDLYNQGKIKEAKKLFQKVLSKYPTQSHALNYLSIIAFREKDYIKSRAYIETFLRDNPNDAVFLNRLGQIQLIFQDFRSAETSFLKALKNNPDLFEIHFNLGRVYQIIGLVDKSKNEFQRVLELNPDHKKARNYLKDLMRESSRTVPGPRESNKLLIQGQNLLRNGDYSRAYPVFQKLHKQYPDDYVICYNLGILHFTQSQFAHAIPILWQAKQLGGSKSIIPFLYYLYSKISICDWTDYEENVKELIQLTEEYINSKPDFQIPVYILNYFKVPRILIAKIDWHQSHLISQLYPKKYFQGSGKKTFTNKKIRIGYISTKFRTSPGGVLLHKVFQHHDRTKFEVFGYSLKKLNFNDNFTKHFNESFDFLKDLSSYSDQEAAHLIHEDQIDILISLAGYDGEMRLGILAQQPSPIQVNWAGYHESIGSDFIQYSILDKSLNSENTNQFYQEKILEVPGCNLINSPLRSTAKVSKEEYNVPENAFIYTCQNHPKKISPLEITVWTQILEKNTNSILWIYDGGNYQVRNNLKKAFIERNIDKERIIFCAQEKINRFWKRLEIADLFLDTFIYNAHVTAIEVLYAGTPILTLEGNTNYSKLCSSILRAAGLTELICKSEDEYIQKAVEFGVEDKIKVLKEKLSKSKEKEILFDTKMNIRNFEKVFTNLVN